MFQLQINNENITEPKRILLEQKNFFEKLFEEDTNVNADKMPANNTQKKLTELDNAMLESPITMGEIQKVIKQMSNEKKPGPDGLPVEVYKVFWS